MRTPEQTVKLLDYRREKASDAIVPKPPALSSSGWGSIYLELHQQPKFETSTLHMRTSRTQELKRV